MTRTDDDLQRKWLAGRTHRLTGAPLRIRRFDLPRGSMVSAAAHMPHAVEPRSVAGHGTRLCTLFAFAKPDARGELSRSPERRRGGYALPDAVARMAAAGEIPTVRKGPRNIFSLY